MLSKQQKEVIVMDAREPLANVAAPVPDRWAFRLYIVGQTPKSVAAIANLRNLCDRYLAGVTCEIEVVDLLLSPHLAEADEIVVIPTLVKSVPGPPRRVFGDLSDTEKVLVGLQLRPRSPERKP